MAAGSSWSATHEEQPAGCATRALDDAAFPVLPFAAEAPPRTPPSSTQSSPVVQGRALPSQRPQRGRASESAAYNVAALLDTSMAVATAAVGLLLLAGSQVFARAAYGALLLMASAVRVAIGVDRWLSIRSSRKKEKLAQESLHSSPRPPTPAAFVAFAPDAEALTEREEGEAAAKEIEEAAATAIVDATFATEPVVTVKEAAAEQWVTDEPPRSKEEHQLEGYPSSGFQSSAKRISGCSTEVENLAARLAQAQLECGDLARRLGEALEELGAVGQEVKRISKVSRLRAARNLRLAARLTRVHRLRVQEAIARHRPKDPQAPPKEPHPEVLHADGAATPARSPSDVHPIFETEDSTMEPLSPWELQPTKEAPVIASANSPAEPLEQTRRVDIRALEAHGQRGILIAPCAADSAGEDQHTETVPAEAGAQAPTVDAGHVQSTPAKSDLIGRLTQIATSSPELRESLRQRLHASRGTSAEAPDNETSPTAPLTAADVAPLGQNPTDICFHASLRDGIAAEHRDTISQSSSAAVGSTAARTEILTRLSQLTALNEDLRAELCTRSSELATASHEAATLREAASSQAVEVGRLKAQSDASELQAAEAVADLRANRQLVAAAEVFGPPTKEPALSLHWADAWDWPGGTARSNGHERLRRTMSGRSAKLSVGPPPVDWQTWMHLGLRHGQPTDPAVLRLVVPSAEDGTYIGLLWHAAAA